MGMKRAIRLCAAMVFLALGGCSSITASSDVSPTADFADLHTFAWEPNRQMDGALDQSIAGQEIHAAVNEALEAHGFRPANGAPPDFLVDYRVTTQNQSEIFGGRWNVQEYHYTVGTLMVALVDPKTNLFLWQGNAQGIVEPGSDSTQDIRPAVQKMFANFPS
jgi:Domain of unknown function (DUF4136)